MRYTIKSAQYANAEHTAAVIDTVEAAHVVISKVDTPKEWSEMLAWGMPADFVPDQEPRRLVPKSLIISRLTDAQLDTALALMTTRQKERWRSPDHPAVYADDPETVGLLNAIGADPTVVLA